MDEVERRLRETIRQAPKDAHARQVYADWLEQHGYETHATFLRLDSVDATPMDALAAAAQPLDLAWRREMSRAPVARCVTFALACPLRWDELTPKSAAARHCGKCGKDVMFVETALEAQRFAREGHCIAIDPAVARGDIERAYDFATRPPPMMGVVAPRRPPPPPEPRPEPPPKGGVVQKVKDWFTK